MELLIKNIHRSFSNALSLLAKSPLKSGDDIANKKLIQVDISSDTVCSWCFIGKRNLEKAVASSKDQFDFEVRWHPYILHPTAPKEGVLKKEFYMEKYGSQYQGTGNQISEVFHRHDIEYNVCDLTGNTLDSHRLISFAAHQGLDKQDALVEELFLAYFSRGKYIGDKKILLEAAKKVGIEGADEFLEDANKGVNEVYEELQKYSTNTSGVPYYVINGRHKFSGGQPPEVFVAAFQAVANDDSCC